MPARALAFFRTIAGAQAKLHGLFAPYFALALPHARRVLASATPPAAAAAAAPVPPSAAKKKRKRPAEEAEQPAAAAGAGAAVACGPTEAALLHATLGFVCRGLRHDGRYTSPVSPLHLPCISPVSPLYLPCISGCATTAGAPRPSPRTPPTSRLHLADISPVSPQARRAPH